LIGETLGKYRITDHLGHGGMAEVYKAYHRGLDRYVAIKIMHPFLAQEANFLTRFQREAKAVAALRHPNIVQVFDFDYDQDRNIYYMVMEFIDGLSLKVRLQKLVERGERMLLDEAVRITSAVGDALAYAHRRGMVHRDVKPANVMFSSEGQAILTDFGIAKMVDVAGLTASGSMVGTPSYMAPEQGMGHAGDERSDIYSLGVMLYQMLTGVLPFEADTPMGVVLKHISEPMPSPRTIRPDLSVGLEQVIVRAMAKDPAQRYQTAADFVQDLRRAASGLEITPLPLEATVATSAVEQTMRVEQATLLAGQSTPPPPAGQVTPPPAVPASRSGWRWVLMAMLAVIALSMVTVVVLLFLNPPTWLLGAVPPTIVGTSGGVPPDLAATQFAATMGAMQATLGAPTSTSIPTQTPAPTPDWTATAVAACEDEVQLVTDEPVWPVVLAPGQAFTKRWVVLNSGTCPWRSGFAVAFVSGEQMGGPESLRAETVEAGGEWEIVVDLVAPATDGNHTGAWQFRDDAGNPLGEPLTVAVRVGPTPTPQPPPPTPTPEASPTPAGPLEMSWPYLMPESCWRGDVPGKWGGTVCWNVAGGSFAERHYFYGAVASEFELPTACHTFEAQLHADHRQIYYTVAGVGVFWPLEEGCCSGPSGYYRTPEGYEVVWRVGQVDEDDCRH
jgi:tRNA A-37 threonylcarbamoyl transferase component Bud32